VLRAPDWCEPILGFFLISSDMNMGWFVAVADIEKEAVWTHAKYSWHRTSLTFLVRLETDLITPIVRHVIDHFAIAKTAVFLQPAEHTLYGKSSLAQKLFRLGKGMSTGGRVRMD
jgi:hypothetical protein